MKKFKLDSFPTDTPSSYPTREMSELFDAILSIRSMDEAAKFFRDLLTIAELTEFANRWQMVKLLREGNSYISIASKLKGSTSTVTRVAHWLFHGFGGYQLIADRLMEKRLVGRNSEAPRAKARGIS